MKKLLLPFLALLITASCSTDFDINGEWQEITIVYGLLNQNEDTTFLKINKAFLGDDNALYMATIADSSSYFNDLEVNIEEWTVNPPGDINGNPVNYQKTISFDTTTLYPKEPGQFYYPKQILYKAFTKGLLNPNNLYLLKIRNKKTGKEITAKTILVGNYSITQPSNSIDFTNMNPNSPSRAKWKTGKNGRMYEARLRFKYKELTAGNPDTVYKSFDWVLSTAKSTELTGGEVLEITYSNKYFYTLLEQNMTKNPQISRFADRAEIIVSSAADEFSTYLDVSSPSNSLIQEKPDFTNITNGIGLFSSRTEVKRNLKVLSTTIDTLKYLGYGF